jgi:hypothetical protein
VLDSVDHAFAAATGRVHATRATGSADASDISASVVARADAVVARAGIRGLAAAADD